MKPRRGTFPKTVGAYELILPIASGGMGTVYLARKRGPGGFERDVALKLTHAFLREQPEFAAQLIEEAKIASRIVHPNVVQVLDVEDDEYGVFLVMQYVEGDTLAALMQNAMSRGKTVPTDVALRVLADALTGLHAAHELRDPDGNPLGIVHRDFTPQNILVSTDGASKLTDFGVAKAATRAGGTRTGIVKGKTAYMSPEQVRAQPLDRRCDVWSAGVIAWEVFAGRRLRDMDTDPAALLLRIATEPVQRLSSVCRDIPPSVDEAVAWALAHDRAKRCPTAEQFRDRLLRAWGPYASPAEASEVAEHVQMVAGVELLERRARASESSTGQRSSVGPSVDVDGFDEASQLAAAESLSSGALETEASLSSAAAAPPPHRGRRLWVLALESAIVGGALGVLVLGARRLMTPVTVVTQAPSVSDAQEVPAAPVVAKADVPAAPVATVASVAPTEPSPAPSFELPASNPSSAPRSASPHGVHAAGAGRRPGSNPARSVEAGATEPPLAKSPYE